MESPIKTPWWIIVLIIIAMLPGFSFPQLLSATEPDTQARVFVWLYPAYLLAAGWLAYICYPRRQTVTWMILILMLMTHAALWTLIIY